MRRRRMLALALPFVLALALAACGGGDDDEAAEGATTTAEVATAGETAAAGDTGVATEEPAETGEGGGDLEAVRAQIEEFSAVPEFQPPGEPFDAVAAVQGKTLCVIPASNQVPFVQTIANYMREIADRVGIRFIEWKNQGQPSQWVAGMESCIDQGADSIDLLAGIDPALLQPQIQAAKEAGIPTVVSHLYDVNQETAPNLGGLVNIPYEQAGRLLADYAILDTGGDLNALVLTINQVTSTEPMVNGIKSEVEQHCPDCKLTFADATIPELATKVQPAVQSAIAGDPDLNYVIALYDSAQAPFAEAAIRAAGASDRVKIVTFNGTPEILKKVAEEDIIVADVGENLEWIAYAIMDQQMRLMAGLDPVEDEGVPLRIFDDANIAETGADFTGGWGTSYVDGYEALWGLSE